MPLAIVRIVKSKSSSRKSSRSKPKRTTRKSSRGKRTGTRSKKH